MNPLEPEISEQLTKMNKILASYKKNPEVCDWSRFHHMGCELLLLSVAKIILTNGSGDELSQAVRSLSDDFTFKNFCPVSELDVLAICNDDQRHWLQRLTGDQLSAIAEFIELAQLM